MAPVAVDHSSFQLVDHGQWIGRCRMSRRPVATIRAGMLMILVRSVAQRARIWPAAIAAARGDVERDHRAGDPGGVGGVSARAPPVRACGEGVVVVDREFGGPVAAGDGLGRGPAGVTPGGDGLGGVLGEAGAAIREVLGGVAPSVPGGQATHESLWGWGQRPKRRVSRGFTRTDAATASCWCGF